MGENLNDWIKQHLEKRGWSIRELAGRSDLSSAYVSNVLNSKQEPGAKFYYGVSKAFGVSLSDIMELDQKGDVREKEDITLKEAIQIASSLTPEQYEDLISYLKSLIYTSTKDDTPEE